jgi:hypothetical protein
MRTLHRQSWRSRSRDRVYPVSLGWRSVAETRVQGLFLQFPGESCDSSHYRVPLCHTVLLGHHAKARLSASRKVHPLDLCESKRWSRARVWADRIAFAESYMLICVSHMLVLSYLLDLPINLLAPATINERET